LFEYKRLRRVEVTGFDTVRSIVAARAWSGRSGGIPLRAATSIVATVHWTVSRGGIRYRSLNRRCSRLERARRSFRLIRSPLFAYGDAPLGRRSARSPTALQAACPNPRLDMQNPGYPQGASGILCRSGGIFALRLPAISIVAARAWSALAARFD